MIRDILESENSVHHWKHFKIESKNVLDLGCGRWHCVEEYEQFSPIWFAENGANMVVGVDENGNDISFYKEKTNGNNKFEFILEHIGSENQIKEWIVKYNITAIKCDIEGFETLLLKLNNDDLVNVDEMAIEFHSFEIRDMFLEKLAEWGYEIHAFSNFSFTPEFIGVLFCSKIK